MATQRNITIMPIQAQDTGRFLLKQTDGKWTFAVRSHSTFNIINMLAEITGVPDPDDIALSYISHTSRETVYHVGVPKELPVQDPNMAWFSIFSFPEQVDPEIPKIFNNSYFRSVILISS